MRATLLWFAAVAGAFGSPVATAGQGIEGSWEVLVCRMECTFGAAADAVASGLVVLTGGIPDPSREPAHLRQRAYQRSWRYLEEEGGGGINGCFAFSTPQWPGDTFVGIITNGYTRWAHDPDTGHLTFPLYYSPDASYDVTLTRDRSGWIGRGASQSAIAEFTGGAHPQEFVRLRRVGTPEVERCFAAIGSPEGLRPVR